MSQKKLTRLNKRLVELGLAPSRRAADELIMNKKVWLNGKNISTLSTITTPSDDIRVGKKAGQQIVHLTIAFNKPAGYVCTHRPQGQQKTIFSLLPKSFNSLKYAGRLDKESQGLIILSSDGDLIQSLSHPSSQKEKEYIVVLNQAPTRDELNKLIIGIKLDGQLAQFKSIKRLNAKTFRVVLITGLNRQIRRSFEHIDKSVIKLERVRIGKFSLATIGSGQYVFIKPEEVA